VGCLNSSESFLNTIGFIRHEHFFQWEGYGCTPNKENCTNQESSRSDSLPACAHVSESDTAMLKNVTEALRIVKDKILSGADGIGIETLLEEHFGKAINDNDIMMDSDQHHENVCNTSWTTDPNPMSSPQPSRLQQSSEASAVAFQLLTPDVNANILSPPIPKKTVDNFDPKSIGLFGNNNN